MDEVQGHESQAVKSRIVGLKRAPMGAIDPFRFGNPRAMTERMRSVLEHSVDELGYVKPIMVREVGTGRAKRYEIIDGHHRFADLQRRGERDAEVLVVDVEDDAKARKLALSLNRIGADWKRDELDAYIDAMLVDGTATAGELLALSGFDGSELDALANHGADFLDDMIADAQAPEGGVGKGSAGDTDDAPERQRGGTQKSGDVVKLQMSCTPSEHTAIYDAIRMVRSSDPELTAVQALAAICSKYTEAKS